MALTLPLLLVSQVAVATGRPPAPIFADVPVAERVAGSRAGTVRWIVHLDGTTAAPQMRQAPFVRAVEATGGRVVSQLWLVNACTIEVTPEALDVLRRRPEVLRVQPDRYIAPSFIKTSTNARNHRVDARREHVVRGHG